jgi:hypothetical protein
MSTTATAEAPITRRDLADGKIERVMSERTALVPMSDLTGGLRFENALQMAEAAKLMATAGPMLPPWLQGNVGGCWGIILRATELGISPLTLANWSYVTENRGVQRVAYESQLYHAIIEARAPITTRLNHEIIGTGDERRCRVWATFKGEGEPRSFTSETLGSLRPATNEYGKVKGSQLWIDKPEVQMFYDGSRDWARIYCPDILGGIYARDEFPDAEPVRIGPDRARDVSPKLAERLRGPGGEGFPGQCVAQHIDAALDAARDPKHKSKTAGKHEPPLVPAGDGPDAAPPAVVEAGADAVASASAPTLSDPPSTSVPQGNDDGRDGAAPDDPSPTKAGTADQKSAAKADETKGAQ